MKRSIDCGLLFSTGLLVLGATGALAAPSVISVTPGNGPTMGGLTLTVIGTGFSPSGNSVSVDGSTCPIVLESGVEIRCTSPEGTGASNDVVVTDDTGTGSNARNFSYDAPSISSITPSSGPALGGTRITIQGSNFGPTSADSLRSVLVGATGEECTIVPGAGGHASVQCVMPPGTGTSDVTMIVDGQASNTEPFTYVPPPSLSSISVSDASTTGGGTLTINGTEFKASGNSVTVGGANCPPTLESPTQIRCTVPEGLGTGLEVVVTADGQNGGGQYFAYSPPSILSVMPDHGPTEGNVPITINGLNFGPASADAQRSVLVGTASCPLVASASNHSVVECMLPEGQGVGRTVAVTAGGQASNGVSFSYDPPEITSISPARASAGGGTLITITGSNFGQTASVSVDGESCPLTLQSHSELRCTGPAATAGDAVPVLVVVSGQVDSSPIDYEVPACGNDIRDIQTGEVCDDGNVLSGDGCSSDCRIEQPQSRDQAACIVAMNKAGAKVFAASGKDALACAVKDVAAPCVGTVTSSSSTKALEKVAAAFEKKCAVTPDFGSTSVAVVQDASSSGPVDLVIDMFGADPDTALAPDASSPNRASCQNDVLKAELKYASARLKAFTKCKKSGLKEGDGMIMTDTALGGCLEIADNDPSVAKPKAQQFSTMIDSCLSVAEDRALAFPGVCATAPDTAACLEQRVRCRTCRAVAESDALDLDCDDDDDGLDNASCD